MVRIGLATPAAGLLALSGALALAAAGVAPRRPALPQPRHRAVAAPPARAEAYASESSAALAVARDLFRADRRPATPYEPGRVLSPPSTASPKPVLVLTGVVWGGLPEAVIEGIPGRDGPVVMRVGDAVGGITVRRIDAARVVMAGLDTTWTLTVRKPWQ